MIAVDSSAIVAVVLGKPEEPAFRRIMSLGGGIVGAPTLVETRMALERRIPDPEAVLRRFPIAADLSVIPFDAAMLEAALLAFARYGQGRGHRASLNFGDCLSCAVTHARAVPLLFKGDDFVHTDLVPACGPVS